MLEVSPNEVNVSWKNIESLGLSADKEFVGKMSGISAELASTILASYGAGYAGGVALGAVGATASKVPVVGSALTKLGGATSTIGGSTLGKIALTTPIVALEGAKLYKMGADGKPIFDVIAQGAIDVSGLLAGGEGLTKGIAVGQSIPNYLTRLFKGGVTVKADAVIPDYVLSGKSGFPKFSEEPFKPTAEGYRQMADYYTPEELAIIGKTTSFHATDVDIAKGLASEGALAGRHGTGMFWSPAVSKNFLRIGGASSYVPGLPNIFRTPTIFEGGFDDVIATGLSKADPAMAALGEKYLGKSTLLMPVEQLEEAQAIISTGTKFAQIGGDFYVDFGGGVLVKLKQVAPTTAEAGKAVIDVTGSAYAFEVQSSTTYVPTLTMMSVVGDSYIDAEANSVNLSSSQVDEVATLITSGDLSESQVKNATSALSTESVNALITKLLKSDPSSVSDIIDVQPSSSKASGYKTIASVLSESSNAERSSIINSLDSITLKSVLSQMNPSQIQSLLSSSLDSSSYSIISSQLEILGGESDKHGGNLPKYELQKVKQSTPNVPRFRVVLDGRVTTVEAGGFVEALSRVSGGRGRVASVTRIS